MESTKGVHREGLWTRNLILIIIVNCCSSMSFQILMPTLPVYIEQLEFKEAAIGLVVGTLTLTTILLRPFMGKLIDSWNRKGLLFIGLGIITLSIFIYQFAFTIKTLIILRLIHGVGWGLVTTATSTIAADVIPKSRLGEGIGYYGLSTVLSLAIAPAIGLYIIEKWSFVYLFNFATILTGLGLVFSLLVKYQLRDTIPSDKGLKVGSSPFFERTSVLPALVNLCMSLTLSAIVTFISLYAMEIEIENIGLFFTIYALTLLMIRPLSGYLADRKGFTYVLLPGIISVIFSLVIIIFAGNLLHFIAAAVFYGIGWGAVHPSLQAMIIYRAPTDRIGVANSTFLLSSDIAFGIGAILWGGIASYTGYKGMFVLVLVPAILTMFINARLKQS